tara:strand:+ start:104 stop:580 length:477 start_codon:yes stop_codon:yes gene_type:complete
MIVSCPNCNKKFNINQKLIPDNGRLLQCSNCNHKWHFTITKKNNEIVKNVNLNKKNINLSINRDTKISINPSLTGKLVKNKKTNKNPDITNRNISKNISLGNILNNLIIIFITFTALILILDTFKNYISNYLPILIPLLDNLYLSFFDLYSFVKDLFN